MLLRIVLFNHDATLSEMCLFGQVHPYLYSSQWETRIAAGLAVEAIASHVPIWQPSASSSSGMCCTCFCCVL